MKTPKTTKKEHSFDSKCSHLYCYLEMLQLAKKLERELIKSRKLLQEVVINDVYGDVQIATIEKINHRLKR